MAKKALTAGQLIPTSSTPPSNAGFYRIDKNTIGVVGNLVQKNAQTNVESNVASSANLAAELALIGSPLTYKFPGFTVGRLLASLVASSTATRVGLIVTVTATAHGIPASIFAGSDFFFPGCPSLAAGWYPGFLYVSANAIQFSLPTGTPGADFAGESVNGGAAHLAQTVVASTTLPDNSISAGSRLRLLAYREGSAGAAAKQTFFMLNGAQIGRWSAISNPSGAVTFTVVCDGAKLRGLRNTFDASSASAGVEEPITYTSPVVCSADAALLGAGEYVYTAYAALEVIK